MVALIIVLRIVHIFAGIFWAGVALLNAFILQPGVERMGPEGGPFMQTFMRATNLSRYVSTAALLTTAAGVILWIIRVAPGPAWLTTGIGLGFTLGGLAGVIAWAHGSLVTGRTAARIGALGAEIRAAGGPPTPAQLAEMQALGAKMRESARVSAVLLLITVLGMSAARYLPF